MTAAIQIPYNQHGGRGSSTTVIESHECIQVWQHNLDSSDVPQLQHYTFPSVPVHVNTLQEDLELATYLHNTGIPHAWGTRIRVNSNWNL